MTAKWEPGLPGPSPGNGAQGAGEEGVSRSGIQNTQLPGCRPPRGCLSGLCHCPRAAQPWPWAPLGPMPPIGFGSLGPGALPELQALAVEACVSGLTRPRNLSSALGTFLAVV